MKKQKGGVSFETVELYLYRAVMLIILVIHLVKFLIYELFH